MRREPAWRVFAAEYNDAALEIKGSGEKVPSYVVTPLGSKVNRVFITGVLTDVESVMEGGEYLRAHVSDPTGVFTVYSGQYQQEATNKLQSIEVPAFVAVIGKVRTYIPEEGTLYVSLRPELVREVNAEARDRWIIETCMQTKQRIGAVVEAMKMSQPNVYDLKKLGYSRELSEGIVAALKKYGSVDVNKYATLIRESLQYIAPGTSEKFEEVHAEEKLEIKERKKESKREQKKPKKQEAEHMASASDTAEDPETVVLEVIKELEGEDGAPWDSIVEKCKTKGLDENAIEEALTSLMDKGFIFEPMLGTIKTT
jgi:RPA family protein